MASLSVFGVFWALLAIAGDEVGRQASPLFAQPPSPLANRYYFSGAPVDESRGPNASWAGSSGSGMRTAPGAALGVVTLSQKHWRLTLFDDFRGKAPTAPAVDYCYDVLKPQCHIWPNSTTFDCDGVGGLGLSLGVGVSGGDPFPPTRTNLAAAIRTLDTTQNWAAQPLAAVRTRYTQLLDANLRHLNKCTWTIYNMVNWMATDYKGHWAARFDPTQVKVDPAGKGHLELTARHAPLSYACIYGGTQAGPNCQVYVFAPNEVVVGVNYWVDPDPRWPGVYYAPISGGCPHGGSQGVNCQVKSFSQGFLEESGVQYWVDTNPAFPGVYYADTTSYRCKDNIDYLTNGLHFRNLTCPILDGAIMSSYFQNGDYTDPQTGQLRKRGFMQQEGRLEVKLRIPKGVGSFPAAWMMPIVGGWPYKGGEIDIIEARDAANEVYQTYHHGKCYHPNPLQEIPLVDSPWDCRNISGTHSFNMSRGYTIAQREADEFWERDHVYAVEWSAQRLDYYINNVLSGSVAPGSVATGTFPTFGDDPPAPSPLASFGATNFPSSAFYWILNHSTYVPPSSLGRSGKRSPAWRRWFPALQPALQTQTHRIDWVKAYVRCASNTELCPCGGTFTENVGCVLPNASTLQCQQGEPIPVVTGLIYQSPCAPVRHDCIHGGNVAGPNCQAYAFQNPQVIKGITYWVDAEPRWPGVYYAPINGGCPFGGAQGVNCQLRTFQVPLLYVVQGVNYWVDTNPQWPGVYYAPIGGQCIYGGAQGVNCQLMSFAPGQLHVPTHYWVDTNPRWPGVYYAKVGGSCPYGGVSAGPNCLYSGFTNPEVIKGVNYWVDADPRWPGVYYAKVGGQCPFGGSGPVNCQIASFSVPSTYVVQGVNYWVDTNPQYPGVYYAPINGGCPFGGGQGVNCQLLSFAPDFVETGVDYWVDTNPFWPGVYYAPDFR